MADLILGGDITVDYLDDNRRKTLTWTGAATGTRSMNEVYSAMANLLDESAQGDDATCMTADTPVEYTIGAIDANDSDPWFITYECLQHLTGGSLQTTGWSRVVGTDTGIVVIPVNTGSAIVPGDVGLNISMDTDGDIGTLLEVLVPVSGGTEYLIVRPDTNAAANSFDDSPTAGGTMTCNAHAATQTSLATTGEQVWANPYTVTTIDADAHVYAYRGTVAAASRTRVLDINDGNNANSQDWWPEGSYDRCVYLNDYTATGLPLIDGGYIYLWARKGNTLYDNWESLSSASGGHNPVALSAAADGNNTTGYQSITTTAVATDDFAVGDEIEGGTSGARGIITLVSGASPTYTLHYYLIGDPQVTFSTAAETITNNDGTGSATSDTSAPASQGPALSTWFTNNATPSIVHANTNVDIDDDATLEAYSITLNCNSNPLTEVYEWIKYICRNGGVTTGNTDGIEGEQYLGNEVFLKYSGTVTGTITEGSDVTQETSGATGIIVSHNTTDKEIVLRDVRGTFTTHATTSTLTDNDVGGTVEINTTATNFAPVKASPYGTLAGGRFFGARGVVLSNWVAGDENSFQLIADINTPHQRPIAITLSVSNLIGTDETTSTDDHVSMHRLLGAGLAIDKTEYSAVGGEAIGDATLVVDSAITADTAGKSAGAVLNIRDVSNANKHYRIRFSSWATSTFTLANIAIAAADAGTNTTTIVEAGAFTNAKRGDLVLNITRSNAVSYVTSVDSANQATISPAITGQTTADNIELNAIPVVINTLDDVYVSLLDEYAAASLASVSIVYGGPIDYRVKVSNTRATNKIKRFVTDGSTSGTDQNTATIRNTDSIHT